ncbi:MAG: hypothetical protein PHE17_04865 [Thiothrix sp.]|uniref:hypothetical protein n=1 Tax=Thiothrix sp. TaxID=1032 RepID=UPI00262339A8|nr:hypothetical protein [Thiothrix sp.]MDD5392331.1 hypothetical protein [Thiothrix sp.]
MARLVVKRTPWWVAHKKLVMVWLPLATLQAATLTGFGYFYHRLDNLEQQADVSNSRSMVVADTPVMLAATDISVATPVPPVPSSPPVSEADVSVAKEVLLQAATLLRDKTQEDKVVEEDKIVLASVKPEPAPVAVKPADPPKAKAEAKEQPKAEKKKPEPEPVVKEKKQPANSDADKTAIANREALHRSAAATASPLVMPEVKPASAEGGVWVYLGELRGYGWYDQKLHISPSSGLPEVGRTYKTQHIQGFYDAPYGKQRDGEFHLGESVYIQEVRRGAKNDVWAKVSGR